MQAPLLSRRSRPFRTRGFTLVELVTAAAIMSVVMLGVIEVFSIVTRTAAEAQAVQGASQQMRAALDRLNRDLRGLTAEGYLRIDNAVPTTGGDSKYHSDVLAFATIGQAYGTYNPDSCIADAAEVVYTTKVATPDAFRQIAGQAVDYRRGVLARSAWLISGTAANAYESEDTSKAAWLGNLLASGGSLARGTGQTQVWPFLAGDAWGADNASVRRVLATGASEFFVEYWDDSTSTWKNAPKTWNPGSAWPKGLRVTVAVHDPADRGPPDNADGRYKGYVYQEVFYLGVR